MQLKIIKSSFLKYGYPNFINGDTWNNSLVPLHRLTFRFCSAKSESNPDLTKLLNNAAVFEGERNNDWATSPYPKGVIDKRLQYSHALRPRTDPRETSIILFPGEGSQYVGMGHKLITNFEGVKDIFGLASDILKYDLLSLCLQGPKLKLDEPKHAQVAVMVCSFAALEKLKEERPSTVDSCIATAGFGIGELTALTFAGVFSFERAVRLAQLRGEAVQTISEMIPSGMLTIIYKSSTKVHDILEKAKEFALSKGVESPVCEVAYYLFPHCKVIAGHTECLKYIEENKKKLEIVQVRRMKENGAFHTRMMEPARIAFKKYLYKSNIKDPVIAVHSSVDGKMYQNPDDIYKKLAKQIVRPVKWEQVLHVLYERPDGYYFPSTFECGPGTTLTSILKMVNAKAYDNCESVFEEAPV